ncbi:MAG: NAD-dependent epimerase/dehydratase family protein [Sphingomonadales bacterium]|nr:NAD-dependent epimerase/dehydratase family protein [Sphingomonadales bacterium]
MDGQLVIVTGVAGFLGSAVARLLAAEGARVRGVVRASSPRANLADFPGELAEADLRDPAAVARAFTGEPAACLYHVAADYRIWARDPEEIVRNNLGLTRTVMEAALATGIPRVVHTSSVATLLPLHGGPSDETRPARPEQAVGAYKRSKVVAERLVEDMVCTRGLPAVIVNPSTPIGPRDVHPTPTGRILVEAATGKMPAYVDSGLNLVHVDDVARGHLLAAAKGRIGERYVLGGQDVTLAQMLADIAGMVGRKPPTVSLPRAPLFPLAYAAEAFARLTGREPFLSVDSLRMAAHHMYYSSAKAEAELGYTHRPYREALADALAWFRAAGQIDSGLLA